MDVVATISAGATLAKHAFDIASALQDMQTKEAVLAKANELNHAMSDVLAQLLVIQTAAIELQDKNRQLEDEIERLNSWEQTKNRYELCQLAPGTLIRRLKPEFSHEEPTHDVCPNCYEQGIKSILQKELPAGSHETYSCPRCKQPYYGREIEAETVVVPTLKSHWS